MAKPEPFLALVHKKNLLSTSLNGPPKNTSPESFLVGTGACFSLTLCLVPHGSHYAVFSADEGTAYYHLLKKNFRCTLKVQILLQQLLLCSS